MLVLSRHLNERIFIGDDIVLTVVSLDGNKVRIGISAPAEIAVHREEVKRRVDAGEPPPPRCPCGKRLSAAPTCAWCGRANHRATS